ncbi:hypothetical protein ACQJBY_011046 [Aegilops geniculata]
MALLHPAPATPLPTGHHRQNAGVLLQRPSRRRFRLNAQKKPGSTSTSPRTGTPSGSESDNVVLKAAWYGSEALGIAASFFRPPSPEADAGAADDGASESQPVGRAQVAEAIKDDFARSYFVTGQELSSTPSPSKIILHVRDLCCVYVWSVLQGTLRSERTKTTASSPTRRVHSEACSASRGTAPTSGPCWRSPT